MSTPTQFIAVSGGTTGMHMMKVFFKDLKSTGPVMAEVGTNSSWPNGVEVRVIKESIKGCYSFYEGKDVYVYKWTDSVVEFEMWDEYVINDIDHNVKILVSADPIPIEASPTSTEAGLSSGYSVAPMLTFLVKIMDTGEWENIHVPNPAAAGDDHPVRALTLKKCLVSQKALANSKFIVNGIRLFRNSSGLCTGTVLKSHDPVWSNKWYVAILNTALEPEYKNDGHTPDSLEGGWGRVGDTSDDYLDGPQ